MSQVCGSKNMNPANGELVPAKQVGYLQTRTSGLIKSWKNRWYELRGGNLYYFKQSPQADGKPSGRIPMDGTDLEVDAPPNPKCRFALLCHTAGRRYELQAEDVRNLELWVNHLTEATSDSSGSKKDRSKPVYTALANLKLFDKQEEVKRKPISIDDFELMSLLGKGSYGRVLKVRKKATGELHALKIMRKDAITKPKEVMSERAVLQIVDHPFVVKLINAFQIPSKLFLVLTYLPGGDMKHHLKQGTLFPEEKSRFYASGIILALAHLHDNSIIYRYDCCISFKKKKKKKKTPTATTTTTTTTQRS